MAREKIIIVDDEADVLDLCSRVLAFDGYQIKTAHNGFEAIDIAAQEQFDLLLTDIKMPGMTGLEIAQALKKTDPNVICVTMTGYSTIDMVIEALKLGIDEFITKPFTPKELSKVVAKALEKVRLKKENYRLHSLIPLFELNKTLMGTMDVDKLLHRLVEIAQKETGADIAIIYVLENDKFTPYAHVTTNQSDEVCPETVDKLARLVLEEGAQLSLSPSNLDDNFHTTILEDMGIQAIIATPLKSQNSNLGVLILAREENLFAPSDSEFLAVLAGQAAIALENAHLFTETQNAYRELKKLDHMKSEFINIAAHELRTPLAILMGYATVLEDDLSGLSKEYLNNIMRNALRLRSLIDDMLNLKHLESGIIAVAKDKLNLYDVLQEIMRDMQLMVDEKKLNISIEIPPNFPPMIADRQKLDLIIMNLLHNAIKFTAANGHVSFKSAINGQKAVMSVADTGIGIPAAEQSRIFDRFYQVERSLTREYGGIGLGLAITRGMVNVCGGEISVQSKEGQGTTFTFTMPLDNTHLEKRSLKL
jgi:signal transduction histidine kinase/ActR/RegA family two-component response regulator